MESYPFTSRVTYDEHGMPLYDRAVNANFLRKFYKAYWSDGIFYKPSSALQVTAGTGMTINVQPGICQIQGAFGIETNTRALSIPAANAQDRIDTVVLRLDLSQDIRSIDLYVLAGTAAASPVRPALTRNVTVWEIGLADIYIAGNSTTIVDSRITDTRLDVERCGVVAQTVGELDTSAWFAQIQAMANETERDCNGLIEQLRKAILDIESLVIPDASVSEEKLTTAVKEMLQSAYDHTSTTITTADGIHGIRFYNNSLEAKVGEEWVKAGLQMKEVNSAIETAFGVAFGGDY